MMAKRVVDGSYDFGGRAKRLFVALYVFCPPK